MKAVQITQFGNPADVVEAIDAPEPPAPGAGEVCLTLELAPINPSDLLLIRGIYGVRPQLPAIVGGEGIARVETAGSGVALRSGDRVILPYGQSNWCEKMTVPAAGLFALPSDADPAQLAMLTINPLTALAMLADYVKLNAGDWVIQDAANSGVGRAVIAIAKSRGLRTVNIVRRAELIAELQALGGDVVLLDGADLPARVAAATNKAKIALGFDGVGGETMRLLLATLAHGATLVVYSGMSGQPGTVFSPHLIFRDLTIRPFWLHTWFQKVAPDHVAALLKELVPLVASGALHVPVVATYALADVKQAVTQAGQLSGKVLLRP